MSLDDKAETAHWAWYNNKYTIQMTEQGPVIDEDPTIAKHRWKAAYETLDNLAIEIREQKIADDLWALGPPPKK